MELSETRVLFYTEKRKSVLIVMDQNSVARASCNATLRIVHLSSSELPNFSQNSNVDIFLHQLPLR